MAEDNNASAGGSPKGPFHQSTFFWGCVGAVVTIVDTVFAAMIKDLRWLLFLAWPFASAAIWEFSQTWALRSNASETARCARDWIAAIGSAVAAVLLFTLYVYLAPPMPAAMPPPIAELPHIKLQLAVEAIGKDHIPFHLEAENIGHIMITGLSRTFYSGNTYDEEPYPPFLKNEVPPGGKIILLGQPVNGLVNTRQLLVSLTYGFEMDGKPTIRGADYRFAILQNVKPGDVIDPIEVKENIAPRPSQFEALAFGRQFELPVGSIMFVIDEYRANGITNNIFRMLNNKRFILDFDHMTAEFAIKMVSGEVKTATTPIPQSNNRRYVIIITWDEHKGIVKAIVKNI
jgi:hypothetical protein